MTWGVDYTSRMRADLVGLDPDVGNAITDMVVAWMAEGPPREHERVVAELTFYEASVADRFLIGYMVDDKAPRFVLLGVRRNQASRRPGHPDQLRGRLIFQGFFSALGRTRTSDARFRKPTLYPLSYEGGPSSG